VKAVARLAPEQFQKCLSNGIVDCQLPIADWKGRAASETNWQLAIGNWK
jgi:hypothetical protein